MMAPDAMALGGRGGDASDGGASTMLASFEPDRVGPSSATQLRDPAR